MNRVDFIDGKTDRLAILILLFDIGVHNQLISCRAVCHLTRYIFRQYIKPLYTFPAIQSQGISIQFLCVVAFKNRF